MKKTNTSIFDTDKPVIETITMVEGCATCDNDLILVDGELICVYCNPQINVMIGKETKGGTYSFVNVLRKVG